MSLFLTFGKRCFVTWTNTLNLFFLDVRSNHSKIRTIGDSGVDILDRMKGFGMLNQRISRQNLLQEKTKAVCLGTSKYLLSFRKKTKSTRLQH